MSESDDLDPDAERRWCAERRESVVRYMSGAGVDHGEIAEDPAWYVAPIVSLWEIESGVSPGYVGWWAISGDCPTDYVSSDGAPDARFALLAFARQWIDHVVACQRGEASSMHFPVLEGRDEAKLLQALGKRAMLFADWVQDESLWHDEAPAENGEGIEDEVRDGDERG